MRMSYFPGCSLAGSAREFDESLRAVAPRLGIELQEVPDWNCCGASAAHTLSPDLALALPARILAAAEAAGPSELLVPCAACYNRLAAARQEVMEHGAARQRVMELTGLSLKGTVKPVNILEALSNLPAGRLEELTVRPSGRKVACYYGCLLVRPHAVTCYDRPEDPESMDRLVEKAGGEPVRWSYKTECCGAGHSVPRPDIVANLGRHILEDAVRRGAEAVVVACPMCHANLDLRRPEIEAAAGRRLGIPVLYITQLLGLALGLDARSLGVHRHEVPLNWPVPGHA